MVEDANINFWPPCACTHTCIPHIHVDHTHTYPGGKAQLIKCLQGPAFDPQSLVCFLKEKNVPYACNPISVEMERGGS